MLLLDTNILSALRRPDKLDPRLAAWAAQAELDCAFVSAVTILEIEEGVLRIERRDQAQGGMLRSWLNDQVLTNYADRILAVDQAVARRCAMLHVPDPRPFKDSLIAATALVHNLTVVTRNVADFEPTGVAVFNPWE